MEIFSGGLAEEELEARRDRVWLLNGATQPTRLIGGVGDRMDVRPDAVVVLE